MKQYYYNEITKRTTIYKFRTKTIEELRKTCGPNAVYLTIRRNVYNFFDGSDYKDEKYIDGSVVRINGVFFNSRVLYLNKIKKPEYNIYKQLIYD